jgi:hypothetical protein
MGVVVGLACKINTKKNTIFQHCCQIRRQIGITAGCLVTVASLNERARAWQMVDGVALLTRWRVMDIEMMRSMWCIKHEI